MKKPKFPIRTTNRLTLRKLEKADAAIVLYLRADAVINQYVHRPEHRKTKTIEDALQHIEKVNHQFNNNESVTWGITLTETNELIGTICLWNFSKDKKTAEVGYDLSTAHHNNGVMTEALRCVLHFGFNHLEFDTIEAYTQSNNLGSLKLLQKCDFTVVKGKEDSDNPLNVVLALKRQEE